MNAYRHFQLLLATALLAMLCATNAHATERELPFSPMEFQEQFNEAARRNNLNLTVTEAPFRDPWCKFQIAKGIEIGGFVHRSDGRIRDLDVTLRMNQNQDYNKFLAAVSCVIDVVDPSIGNGKAELLAQLGLAKRPGPEVKRIEIERNGFEYQARTYDEGQRIYFSVDQSFDSYRAASSGRHSSRRARSSAGAAGIQQPQTNMASSARADVFAPPDDGGDSGTPSVADTPAPSNTRISRVGSDVGSTSRSPQGRGKSGSQVGNALGNILSRASGISVPGLGSVPYSGAARQALRGLSNTSPRGSSRGGARGTDSSSSGDHHWSADGVRAGNPRDLANYSEFMRRKYWGDQSLRVDPNDPYGPRSASSNQRSPQVASGINENASTASVRRQTSTQGLGYQNYSIGMTLDEFQRLALPAGSRLEKHRDRQSATPKVVYTIEGATFDIGSVRWNPTFSFHETPAGFRLTEIRGDIESADIEKVASALANDYGQPNVSKQTLYRWDFPTGLMRVCQALGRDVGEVCFEDRNFIVYEANKGGKLVEPRSYPPITTKEEYDRTLQFAFSPVRVGAPGWEGLEAEHREALSRCETARLAHPEWFRNPSNAMTIPPGWHRLACPPGIDPGRWEEIQEYVFQTTLDQDYRPRVGDVCFVGMTEMGWMTPAAKDSWTHAYLKEREGKNDFKQPSQKFFEDTAAQSNGTLIALNAGTKVRILEGTWKAKELMPVNGAKIQILSGPHTGKSCFTMGIGYGKHPPNPNQINEFCRTESDKRAIQAIFVSRSLSRNGDVSLTPDELRLHTLLERD